MALKFMSMKVDSLKNTIQYNMSKEILQMKGTIYSLTSIHLKGATLLKLIIHLVFYLYGYYSMKTQRN